MAVAGNDYIEGGTGNDNILAGTGYDIIDPGTGLMMLIVEKITLKMLSALILTRQVLIL